MQAEQRCAPAGPTRACARRARTKTSLCGTLRLRIDGLQRARHGQHQGAQGHRARAGQACRQGLPQGAREWQHRCVAACVTCGTAGQAAGRRVTSGAAGARCDEPRAPVPALHRLVRILVARACSCVGMHCMRTQFTASMLCSVELPSESYAPLNAVCGRRSVAAHRVNTPAGARRASD